MGSNEHSSKGGRRPLLEDMLMIGAMLDLSVVCLMLSLSIGLAIGGCDCLSAHWTAFTVISGDV